MRHLLPLFLVVIPLFSNADSLKDDHLKPTLTQGFDKTGWIIIGSGLLGVALVQPHDQEIRAQWSNHQKMSESTSRIGDITGMGIPGAIIAGAQLLWDYDNGMAHAEGLIFAVSVNGILKVVNQRNRPNSDNRLSMPSGHSTAAFASATALSYAYGWKAAIPGYALAALTAASRWSDDAHWASDTVAGAMVGIFWGRAAALHHHGEWMTSIVPHWDSQGYSLTFVTHY